MSIIRCPVLARNLVKTFCQQHKTLSTVNRLTIGNYQTQMSSSRFFSTPVKHHNGDEKTKQPVVHEKVIEGYYKEETNLKGQFKALVRDYGAVAFVFHITISLASLGICYILVKYSFPIERVMIYLNVDKYISTSNMNTSATFIIAYALHKSLMFTRLLITVTCVPLIVRVLRSKNILKPPKMKPGMKEEYDSITKK